jgi:hypothetical protein
MKRIEFGLTLLVKWRADFEQAPWISETPAGAACTVSIGEHIVLPLTSELPIERLPSFLYQSSTMSPRCYLPVWSNLAPREVEVKVASTAAVLFDNSESIIDAICSQTRGSFSIS